MCAGRGVCNYENVVNGTIQPKCECFDTSDTSPGCSDSLLPTGDFLDDATGLFDNVEEDFFDPLIAVFVDHPDKWTSSSWAWAAGLLTVFFIMVLCICSTFWPESKKDKDAYQGSGSPEKKSPRTTPSSKNKQSSKLGSIPSPSDSSSKPKKSSKKGSPRESSTLVESTSKRERSSSSSRRHTSSSATSSRQRTSPSHNTGVEYDHQERVSPRNYPTTTSSYVPQVRSPTRRQQAKSYGYDYDRPASPHAAEL